MFGPVQGLIAHAERSFLRASCSFALPDLIARFMISVATSGWVSHQSASWASVRKVGIMIDFLAMVISLRSRVVVVSSCHKPSRCGSCRAARHTESYGAGPPWCGRNTARALRFRAAARLLPRARSWLPLEAYTLHSMDTVKTRAK